MRAPVRPGDIFEDCAYHPVLCYRAEPRVNGSSGWWRRWVLYEIFGSADDWDIDGISRSVRSWRDLNP